MVKNKVNTHRRDDSEARPLHVAPHPSSSARHQFQRNYPFTRDPDPCYMSSNYASLHPWAPQFQGYGHPYSSPQFRTSQDAGHRRPEESELYSSSFAGNSSHLDGIRTRAEKAAQIACEVMLAKGEAVTLWKVAQTVLQNLKRESFELLGIQPDDIPCLHKLKLLEGKVNAYIECHVAVRKITTLFDLSIEICKHEGVKDFQSLGLGPLTVQPLVKQYFAPPTDLEYVKVTTYDVLRYLSDYIDNTDRSDIHLEGFLDYVAKERSLPSHRHLCVHVQSFGPYIELMQQEKEAEKAILNRRSSLATVKTPFACQSGIMERVKSFLASAQKEEEVLVCEPTLVSSVIQPSSCPYPSVAEERARLQAKDAEKEFEYDMTRQELGDFVATWRGICQKLSVTQVFAQMVHQESTHMPKKGKKLARLFKHLPAIGLLNVAVLSMKDGHWNSLYDAFEEALMKDAQKYQETNTMENLDWMEISDKPAVKLSVSGSVMEVAPSSKEILNKSLSIIHDLCEEVCMDLEQSPGLLDVKRVCMVVKAVVKFEKLLAECFHVADLSDLKCGDFACFIEQHWDLLVEHMSPVLEKRGEPRQGQLSFPEERLHKFLGQVLTAVGDGKELSPEFVLKLLCRQFHLRDLEEGLLTSVEKCLKSANGNNALNYPVFFSSALLVGKEGRPFYSETYQWPQSEEATIQVGLLGSVSNADARQCLVNAPLFCDLMKWSQWNSVFLPTLGPFLDWIERESLITGLVCLATCDGSFFRIDDSATVDSFLGAAVEGLGRRTAWQLVSLLVLYGGVDWVPSALLRSHMSQALDILVNKACTIGANKRKTIPSLERQWDMKRAKYKIHEDTPPLMWSRCQQDEDMREYALAEKYMAAFQFVFDVILYTPFEFTLFVASVVLPPLFENVPIAPKTMLWLCDSYDVRIKLHHIGLHLGYADWSRDFQALFLSPTGSEHVATAERCTIKDSSFAGMSFLAPDVTMHMNEQQNQDYTNAKTCIVNMAGSDTDRNISVESDCASEKEREAKSVIALIRKEEFGVDMDLEGRESRLLLKQHARIGRALQCLSRELYSQDSHFVLELVQNADDNKYPLGVDAMLVFILQPKRVIVINNEVGFSEANMRALCDVGNSTKSGSAAGYIGHKGIGFKSVFRVTDAPEIHSNGFHVKFDVSAGQIGFILPTEIQPMSGWSEVQQVLSLTEDLTGSTEQQWNTCLVLPLKPSILHNSDIDILCSKLSDIQPSLLLFLHRLRSIAIKDEVRGSMHVMQRCDLKDGLLQVKDGESHATWLVVKQMLSPMVERRGVEITELALAFPLREVGVDSYESCNEQQQVFSFLPLRSYGLRFIIQADFILPSSREELDTDSAWNQWLLSEVPNICLKAVSAFRDLPCFKMNPGKAASTFMDFMPCEGEVQGFFSSLPRTIVAKLRGSKCLPVEGKDNEWALSCIMLGGWSEACRRLLPDQLLKECLGLYYLHRNVNIRSTLASGLGLQMYGSQFLVKFMETLCTRKDSLGSLGPRWIGSWLVALHKCFTSESQQSFGFSTAKVEAEELRKLKKLSFIPLTGGAYTSLVDGPVWLPFNNTTNQMGSISIINDFPLLYSELRTVDTALLDPIDFESNEDMDALFVENENHHLVQLMLHRLGVGEISGHEVMMAHILPQMHSNDLLQKPRMLLVQLLAFVMVHLNSECSQCKADVQKIILQLHETAIFKTNNGFIRAGVETVHFGTKFGCPIDACGIFGGLQIKWNEIDPVYLHVVKGWTEEATLSNWRVFFKKIGVTDFVKVQLVTKTLKEIDKSIWKDTVLEGHDGNSDIKFEDWESLELVEILEQLCVASLDTSIRLEAAARVLSSMDLLWETDYSACSELHSTHEMLKQKIMSTFILKMRSFAWIKSSVDEDLHYPTELYYRCPSVESLLGTSAPFATPQVHCTKLAECLGFRMSVSVMELLDLFKSWNRCPFEASVSQMECVYKFLWNEMSSYKDAVMQFFKTEASIFVPEKLCCNKNKNDQGRFFKVEDVFWKDETNCVSLLTPNGISKETSGQLLCLKPLSSIYPTLHEFFLHELHVRDSLDFMDYFTVLKMLAGMYAPSDILNKAIGILAKLSDYIHMGLVSSTNLNTWKELLEEADNRVLPTVQNEWVSLNKSVGVVCWCDDELLGQQFVKSKGIFYVDLRGATGRKLKARADGATSAGECDAFLQAMGILPLSKVVQREPIVYGARESKLLFDLLNWTMPYIQRYMQKWHVDIYEELKHIFAIKSRRFHCVLADQLYFQYRIDGVYDSCGQRIACEYLLQGDTFYATQLENLNPLFLEFSRLFFKGTPSSQLANFLHLITLSVESGSDHNELEALLASQGIKPSLDEIQWTFELLYAESEGLEKPREGGRGFTDHVWPPFTFTQSKHNHVSASQRGRLVACEQSLASVMEEIELKTHKKLWQKSDNRQSPLEKVAGHTLGTLKGEIFNEVMAPLAGNSSFPSASISMDSDAARNMEAALNDVTFSDRPQLGTGRQNGLQSRITGRLGEAIVFNYLLQQHGPERVSWLNSDGETGFPYDIVLQGSDGQKKLIEVKTTWRKDKDWFEISGPEWQLAVQAGERYIIIRVLLMSEAGEARFLWLPNPARLWNERIIQLALVLPQHVGLPTSSVHDLTTF